MPKLHKVRAACTLCRSHDAVVYCCAHGAVLCSHCDRKEHPEGFLNGDGLVTGDRKGEGTAGRDEGAASLSASRDASDEPQPTTRPVRQARARGRRPMRPPSTGEADGMSAPSGKEASVVFSVVVPVHGVCHAIAAPVTPKRPSRRGSQRQLSPVEEVSVSLAQQVYISSSASSSAVLTTDTGKNSDVREGAPSIETPPDETRSSGSSSSSSSSAEGSNERSRGSHGDRKHASARQAAMKATAPRAVTHVRHPIVGPAVLLLCDGCGRMPAVVYCVGDRNCYCDACARQPEVHRHALRQRGLAPAATSQSSGAKRDGNSGRRYESGGSGGSGSGSGEPEPKSETPSGARGDPTSSTPADTFPEVGRPVTPPSSTMPPPPPATAATPGAQPRADGHAAALMMLLANEELLSSRDSDSMSRGRRAARAGADALDEPDEESLSVGRASARSGEFDNDRGGQASASGPSTQQLEAYVPSEQELVAAARAAMHELASASGNGSRSNGSSNDLAAAAAATELGQASPSARTGALLGSMPCCVNITALDVRTCVDVAKSARVVTPTPTALRKSAPSSAAGKPADAERMVDVARTPGEVATGDEAATSGERGSRAAPTLRGNAGQRSKLRGTGAGAHHSPTLAEAQRALVAQAASAAAATDAYFAEGDGLVVHRADADVVKGASRAVTRRRRELSGAGRCDKPIHAPSLSRPHPPPLPPKSGAAVAPTQRRSRLFDSDPMDEALAPELSTEKRVGGAHESGVLEVPPPPGKTPTPSALSGKQRRAGAPSPAASVEHDTELHLEEPTLARLEAQEQRRSDWPTMSNLSRRRAESARSKVDRWLSEASIPTAITPSTAAAAAGVRPAPSRPPPSTSPAEGGAPLRKPRHGSRRLPRALGESADPSVASTGSRGSSRGDVAIDLSTYATPLPLGILSDRTPSSGSAAAHNDSNGDDSGAGTGTPAAKRRRRRHRVPPRATAAAVGAVGAERMRLDATWSAELKAATARRCRGR